MNAFSVWDLGDFLLKFMSCDKSCCFHERYQQESSMKHILCKKCFYALWSVKNFGSVKNLCYKLWENLQYYPKGISRRKRKVNVIFLESIKGLFYSEQL